MVNWWDFRPCCIGHVHLSKEDVCMNTGAEEPTSVARLALKERQLT